MSGDASIDPSDPTERFEILAKLGEGSYGAVFKAYDRSTGAVVAIKVLEVDNADTAELMKEISILRGMPIRIHCQILRLVRMRWKSLDRHGVYGRGIIM